MADDGLLRIGELSKRSGVSPELLRAWERRYGLLRPARSGGGLRLYSAADVERVRMMRQHLAEGLAAAQAAALALGADQPEEAASAAVSPAALRHELAAALDGFDEARAQAVIDRALAATTLDTLLAAIVLPYLRELGERWARGEVSIAHEHFASTVLRGRLLGLARGWGHGRGPAAVLACLPGEQHDLGLIAFGLALRARGWRIVYLGADTPLETVADGAERLAPDLLVLAATSAARVRQNMAALRELARRHRVALGGQGVAEDTLGEGGILALQGDPVSEAERLTIREPADVAAGVRPPRSPSG